MKVFKKSKDGGIRGFTLIELLVSISIFAMMTALLVAKYGTFNQGVLLTNLAYDVALTIRTAQTFGLSVKGITDSTSPCNNSYQCVYGVKFSTVLGEYQKIIFYARQPSSDPVGSLLYNQSIEYNSNSEVSTYNIKRGAKVIKVCLNQTINQDCMVEGVGVTNVNIVFKRPDPNAIICDATPGVDSCNHTSATIVLQGTDNSTRSVYVSSNGQISVDN